MRGTDPAESPLEAAAGITGPEVVDVFELLGDETRLAILLALWEAFDPYAAENAVPFAALRKSVGLRHGEQFHYHLERLVDEFVRKTDAGYELRDSGRRLVQTIIAGAGMGDRTIEGHEVDMPCWICGAPMEVSYRNERVYTACTECEGSMSVKQTDDPRGTVSAFSFTPAGLSDRTPEEIVAASIFRGMCQYVMRMGDLCPLCSASIESWFDVCEDHDPTDHELCSTCARRWEIETRWQCTVCKHWGVAPPSSVAILHPKVVAFYESRGVEIGYPIINHFGRIKQFWALMAAHEQELVSAHPPLVRVTIRYGGDELRLTFDEGMTLVDSPEGD